MSAVRKVDLQDDHDEQVVRLPSDLKLPGKEAIVRREGARIVLEPVRADPPRAAHPANQALVDLLASWEPIEEEIGPIEDFPPKPVNL